MLLKTWVSFICYAVFLPIFMVYSALAVILDGNPFLEKYLVCNKRSDRRIAY